MALDPVTKIEITAHTSIIDTLLEELQQLGIMQIDPHGIEEWESEKTLIHETGDWISDLRRELLDVEAALKFLDDYKPRVSIIEKLNTPPDVVSKDDLKKYAEIWAAAGSPFAVFQLKPADLEPLTRGKWTDLAQAGK